MKKIAFIVNPKAGIKKNIDIAAFIKGNFSRDIFSEIILWEEKNKLDTIREKLLSENFSIAVAVGGDGTVNAIASIINKTNIALGIIPLGSGNGLARSIGIPLDPALALKRLEKGAFKFIDSGLINEVPFFCTAGLGFDAHVGERFAFAPKRGFWSYVKITLAEILSYKPQEYTIEYDGKKIIRQAFGITFANASQYGNDFFIAPAARMSDGLLHLVILKPFPLIAAPFLAYKIFRKKAESSRYIETFTAKDISVTRNGEAPVHFDGEPGSMGTHVHIHLVPASLKIVY